MKYIEAKNKAKEPSFDLLGRFVRFLKVEETSPLLCKQAISNLDFILQKIRVGRIEEK